MSGAIESRTVETVAGEYIVTLYPDYDASNPIEDDEAFAVVIEFSGYGGRWDESTNTLSNAGDAGDVLRALLDTHGHDTDAVSRRYLKWAALTDSRWVLAMGGQSASQSDYYRYALLADRDELGDVNAAIRAAMHDYQTLASGGVVGFVTTAPNGEVVESVWGYYEFEDAYGEATDAAHGDAEKRAQAVNLVGAGFVGIL
jgi:hypothetical protein